MAASPEQTYTREYQHSGNFTEADTVLSMSSLWGNTFCGLIDATRRLLKKVNSRSPDLTSLTIFHQPSWTGNAFARNSNFLLAQGQAYSTIQCARNFSFGGIVSDRESPLSACVVSSLYKASSSSTRAQRTGEHAESPNVSVIIVPRLKGKFSSGLSCHARRFLTKI
jgi:hypothetical protein